MRPVACDCRPTGWLRCSATPPFIAPPPPPPPDIDNAGASLVAFLLYLRDTYNVKEFDLIAHSMGGLFSRAALLNLHSRGWPVRVNSFTTIGSPWDGVWGADIVWSSLGDFVDGLVTVADCQGDAVTLGILGAFVNLTSPFKTIGYGVGPFLDTTTPYTRAWNTRHAGVLDGVAVNLIGGGYFRAPRPGDANPKVWPHDGLPSLASVLAVGVPESILPRASLCLNATFPNNVHSAFFAHEFGLPLTQGLTFNPEVMASIDASLRSMCTRNVSATFKF